MILKEFMMKINSFLYIVSLSFELFTNISMTYQKNMDKGAVSDYI